MASAPTHALIGAAIGLCFTAALTSRSGADGTSDASPPSSSFDDLQHALSLAADRRLLARLPWYSAFLSVIPDADTLMHAFVRYSHPFGHRGAFHSLGFFLGFCALLVRFPVFATRRMAAFVCLFLSMASHSLLDMLTNGGLGIGLFWPISNARLFFPWRPIPVSPLHVDSFFSVWGLRVLAAELPFAVVAFVVAWIWRRRVMQGSISTSGR
jgi:inner membrane protein